MDLILGTEIGSYLDPEMIDLPEGSIGPILNSDTWDITGIIEVPLVDGRIALVDSDGLVVGFK